MKKLITILGPTASGKTSIATKLADRIGGEIISADSRQVYKRMDIGTGKDLSDYEINGKVIPYHLIDICEPGTKYNLFRYQQDFISAYNEIQQRGVWPILCGGTGLYIESVLKGYDLSPVPQNEELRASLATKTLEELTDMLMELKSQSGSNMHNKTDVDTCNRAIRAIEIESYNLKHPVEYRKTSAVPSIIIGVDVDREVRRNRITFRLKKRLEDGLVEEIQSLLDENISPDDLMYYGLEYKFVTKYCIGEITYEEMFKQLEIAIHQFSKRQMTWFRGMERRGFNIHWVKAPTDPEVMENVLTDIIALVRQ